VRSRKRGPGGQIIERSEISIAVVGAGLIGRRHAAAIAGVPGTRLACMVDPDPAAGMVAASMGAPLRATLAECLDGDRPDALILATPNHLHVPQGLECFATGVPILVEKPLAADARGGRALVEAASVAGVTLLVGHHRRHNPLIAAAKARIEAGEVGEIVAVSALCWLCKPDAYFDTAWRGKAGAGPVFINLIHDADLLRHLVGEIVSVQAIERRSRRGGDTEDSAAILLRFESGALGTMSVSDGIAAPWSWELTAAENPAYPRTGESCYLIGGTHGSISLPGGELWRHPGERSWWEPMDRRSHPVASEDPLNLQIANLRDVARGEAAPVVSGLEGLKSLLVIEAVKEAARTGAAVDVAHA